jgi:hypothetical protein
MPLMQFNPRTLAALATVCATSLAACGGGGGDSTETTPPPTSAPPQVERNVLPSSTDAAISTDFETHFVVNPSPAVAAKQLLLVFLPGTFGRPDNYRQIVREAAAQGLHGIGLNYPNNATVASLCSGSSDANCFGNTREEILTGSDTSTAVNTTRANSIESRLIKLLQVMHTQAPTEGWGAYLGATGEPDWSRIRVAGHSQGGGHAAFIAKRHAVDRAIYFGAPADANAAGLAPWVSAPGPTPGTRQAGFTHVRDELAALPVVSATWQALGLGGALTSVDGASPPYGGARQLTTDTAPASGAIALSPLHSTPVVDGVTPLAADGKPLFAPVWRTLAFD